MIDEYVHGDTNQRHNTPQNDIISKRMEYPWHPFFGNSFNIHSHFFRAHVQTYGCRPSDHPERMRLHMPVWMFDRARCSNMKLLKEPYCSLNSLKQLHLLLHEASSSECTISQNPSTFNEKGDANAEIQLTAKHSRSASVSPTRSTSNNLEESVQTAGDTTDETHEQDVSGTPKAPRRKLQ